MIFVPFLSYSQYLSHLEATRNDALFTTYAAPMSRSEYKTDQGYQLSWFDDETALSSFPKMASTSDLLFNWETSYISD
jgi:hypothetical protein